MHYLMIKGSIQEENITIVNIYAPNIGAPQYIRKMLTVIKGEIDRNTIIVGNFNTPLSPIDRSSKMKINKETQALNDALKLVFPYLFSVWLISTGVSELLKSPTIIVLLLISSFIAVSGCLIH